MWCVKEHFVSLAASHWCYEAMRVVEVMATVSNISGGGARASPPVLAGPLSEVPAAFLLHLVLSSSWSCQAALSFKPRAPSLPRSLAPRSPPPRMSGGLWRSVALAMAVALLMQVVGAETSNMDGKYTHKRRDGMMLRQTDW